MTNRNAPTPKRDTDARGNGYDPSQDVLLRTDFGVGYVRRDILERADAERREYRGRMGLPATREADRRAESRNRSEPSRRPRERVARGDNGGAELSPGVGDVLNAVQQGNSGRSKRFNPNVIIPNPALSRDKHGDDGMHVGRMIQAAMLGGRHTKAGSRELELLSELKVEYSSERMVLPFALLARCGRHADKIKARRAAGERTRQKSVEAAGYFREGYTVIGDDGGERSIVSSSTGAGAGGGALPVRLDVDRSQMWLYETAPVLAALNPRMGIQGEYKAWYGSTAPGGGFVGESGSHTATNPALTEIIREPKTIHFPWSVSNSFIAMDANRVASLFEEAVEGQLMNLVTKTMVSGPNVGANFAADTLAFNGLLNSGIGEVSYGAALANFDRAAVIDAEQQLLLNEAIGSDRVWLLSLDVEGEALNQKIGTLHNGVMYLAEQIRPYMGRIGGEVPGAGEGEGTPYVSSGLIGHADGTALNRTAYTALGYGSQALPLFFGDGIEFRVFRPTSATRVDFSLSAEVNFALINPANWTIRNIA